MRYFMFFLIVVVAGLLSTYACAQLTHFQNNKQAWLNAVNNTYTTINFQGYPENTPINSQWSHLGVTFTDGTDRIYYNANSMLNDGVGLYGFFSSSTVEFTTLQHAIATDHPGSVMYEFYYQGVHFATSMPFINSGYGRFSGVVSMLPFDKVRIVDPFSDLFFDDLYFGMPVPTPPVLLVFGGLLFATRRRRS